VTPTSDAAELRTARRERVFDAMARAGLDVLVLGRRDSVAYATGARSLWTAGTRPFGAACVLVADGRTTHLLSTWDAGVPPEVRFEHLYGITWNPATMAAALRAIPGVAAAHRIGVDAVSPGFQRAASRLAPSAQLVPADDVLRAVRAVKLPGEVERIRAACVVARVGADAATAAVRSGAALADARAAALRAVARCGATVPSSGVVVEDAGRADAAEGTGGPAAAGSDAVQVDVGLLVDGYEGGHGRAVARGADADDARSTGIAAAQRRLLGACQPGATAGDLRYAAAGASRWMVRGSGMGFEAPVITDQLGDDAVIQTGMVLSVAAEVDGWLQRDLALVRESTAELL
jgi:Xaa-Pro aminopeptidase